MSKNLTSPLAGLGREADQRAARTAAGEGSPPVAGSPPKGPTPLTAPELQQRLAVSPFIAFLNLTVTDADPARQQVTMTLPMRPEFERGAGTGQWHGGPIAAVIDTVGDYALVMMLGRPLPTINFRIDYLRPAVNTALTATARVRRAGRSVGVVDVDVTDGAGNLVAIGRAAYSTLG